MSTIVIMPGGFHPFHAGHADLYQQAKKAFPGADIYVAATNDQSERPFPFALKEKLAKLAGVESGHFVQVKSPFQAKEITQHYNPEQDVLIFVRSEKDRNEPPKPGGTKKDGSPAYFQPYTGKDLQPFSQHAYIDYLKTVEFGPGITSATQIRNAWPTLNDKRKTALVMSLYPAAQKNLKLAKNIVGMFDQVMGGQQGVAEGSKENNDVKLTYSQSTPNHLYIDATIDGSEAGGAAFKKIDGVWTGDMVYVQPYCRRQGVATKMYDYAEDLVGKITPSNNLKPKGKKFWANRIKQGVAEGYDDEDDEAPYHTRILDQKTKKVIADDGPYEFEDRAVDRAEAYRAWAKTKGMNIVAQVYQPAYGKNYVTWQVPEGDYDLKEQGVTEGIEDNYNKNDAGIKAALQAGVKLIPIQPNNDATGNPIYIHDNSGRYTVAVDMGGISVPFYTSTGLGGKASVAVDKWYPFFGIGSDGWINKGSEATINDFYGSNKLKRVAQVLDNTLGLPSRAKNVTGWPVNRGDENYFISIVNRGLDPAAKSDRSTKFRDNMLSVLRRLGEPNKYVEKAVPVQAARPKAYAFDKNNPEHVAAFDATSQSEREIAMALAKDPKSQGVAEGASLSVEQLAHISDKALDDAYHYGRSTPGANFGWMANMQSAKAAKRLIDAGETDIEVISDAIHKGWNVTAAADYKGQLQLDTPTPEDKKLKRAKLAMQSYSQLPEEEKEKDRVVARALLTALRGKIDETQGLPYPSTYGQETEPLKSHGARRIVAMTNEDSNMSKSLDYLEEK